jgi:glycosyltransferase involved in cell wall biosynthesis
VRLALLSNASVIHTRRWGDYFHARGHQVLLISLEPGQGYAYPCHQLTSRIPWRFLRYPLLQGRVRELLSDFDPELVNAHFVPNYGLIGALVGRHPLVVSVWGSDVLVSGRTTPLHAARVRYVLRRADYVTTDARMLTRAACALGADPERVLTVPMGVDPEPYRAARRAAEPSGSRPALVVSTRKLEPVYDLRTLIDALPALWAGNAALQVALIGDGPERPALAEAARAHAVAARVPGDAITFAGMVPHRAIAEALGRATVYVSTSLSDSTSVSLLEAMAAGAFPVVTDLEANREWIDDEVNGFLIPTGSPADLAARVLEALASPALRARAAAENARRIDARATWTKNMAEVEQLFASLIGASPQRAPAGAHPWGVG